jgi:hypothetical protein
MARVSLSFDLWMSSGCNDIFDLIWNGIDKESALHHAHLRLLQADDTCEDCLSKIMRKAPSEFGLTNKTIGYVKDGESNLKTCTYSLKGIVSCDLLDQSYVFEGPCIAHILSGACNASLAPVMYQTLEHVNIKNIRGKLQVCIIWTKKGCSGREYWLNSCIECDKNERSIPTPVKPGLSLFLR